MKLPYLSSAVRPLGKAAKAGISAFLLWCFLSLLRADIFLCFIFLWLRSDFHFKRWQGIFNLYCNVTFSNFNILCLIFWYMQKLALATNPNVSIKLGRCVKIACAKILCLCSCMCRLVLHAGRIGCKHAQRKIRKVGQSSPSCSLQIEPISWHSDRDLEVKIFDTVQELRPWGLWKMKSDILDLEGWCPCPLELQHLDLMYHIQKCSEEGPLVDLGHQPSSRRIHPEAGHCIWSVDPSELDKIGKLLPPTSPCHFGSANHAGTKASFLTIDLCQSQIGLPILVALPCLPSSQYHSVCIPSGSRSCCIEPFSDKMILICPFPNWVWKGSTCVLSMEASPNQLVLLAVFSKQSSDSSENMPILW